MYMYTWHVPESSGPVSDGPNCMFHLYHSAVDHVRDTHSGLVEARIICKHGLIDRTRLNDSVEKEFVLLFQTFDENRSWSLSDNIQANGPASGYIFN